MFRVVVTRFVVALIMVVVVVVCGYCGDWYVMLSKGGRQLDGKDCGRMKYLSGRCVVAEVSNDIPVDVNITPHRGFRERKRKREGGGHG